MSEIKPIIDRGGHALCNLNCPAYLAEGRCALANDQDTACCEPWYRQRIADLEAERSAIVAKVAEERLLGNRAAAAQDERDAALRRIAELRAEIATYASCAEDDIDDVRQELHERAEAHEELLRWAARGGSVNLEDGYSVEMPSFGGVRYWIAYCGVTAVDGWGEGKTPTKWPTIADAIQHAREGWEREDGE